MSGVSSAPSTPLFSQVMLSPAPSTPRSPHADQSDVLSAEEVVARRSGDVLLRHTILKGDHFPGG